jgi:beta-phosphoglucomutase-like phosphatase (HAD superfamily)
MQQLGLTPSQCIIFEDSPSGVRAGVLAQCTVVGILTSQSSTALRAEGARYTVTDFTKLRLPHLFEHMADFVIDA